MTAVIIGTLAVGPGQEPQMVAARISALAGSGGLATAPAARLTLAVLALIGQPDTDADVELSAVATDDGIRVEAVVRGGSGACADVPTGLVDACLQRAGSSEQVEHVAVIAFDGRGTPRADARSGDDVRALLDAALATSQEQTDRLARYRADFADLMTELNAANLGILALHSELLVQQEKIEQARIVAVRASQASAAFLANMSHEMRSPLNAAMGFADLLRESTLTPDQAEFSAAISAACKHLAGVVDNILDLSKIESGLLELEEIPFDLVRCIEDAAEFFAPQAQAKAIALSVVFSADIPDIVLGDPVRVGQMIINLISNAVKFTTSGHVRVEVRMAPAAEGARHAFAFEVSDTGPGMPADMLARMFERFTQADSTTTREFGGTGLGLSITRELAEHMGGGIKVASILGEGSAFTVTVMLYGGMSGAPGRQADRPLDGLGALVVHPHPAVAEAIDRHLVAWGARTVVVASTAEAVSRLSQWEGAQLAIVAVGSYQGEDPGQSAAALIDAIRALGQDEDRTTMMPVVAVTPLTMDRSSLEDLSRVRTVTGVPVRRDRLRVAVLGALGLSEAMTEHAAGSASAELPASRSGLRVLVADDLAANRRVVSFGLERMGHRVDAVSNGAEAVDAIAAGEYDLVLMDVQMPVVDGISATRTVRSLRPGGHPPIVAITARPTAEIRQACLDAGMDGFLSKPIETADLVRVINEVTQRRGIVPPADAAADHPGGADTPAAATHVLYIEDNPMLRNLVGRILAAEKDVELRTAEDGRSGLDLAAADPPDVILTDLNLSDMTGEMLIERLRAEPQTSEIPVIVVSGDNLAAADRLANLGVSDSITKPFDAARLKAAIAAAARGRPHGAAAQLPR